MKHEKPLPSSIEAERMLLSQCLRRPALVPLVRQVVDLDDFYLDEHGTILELLARLYAAGRQIDVVTLPIDAQAAGYSFE